MPKKKSTTTPPNGFEEYIKNLDEGLANFEKIGAAFLVFGYVNYIRSAQIDILELYDMNNTGTTPDDVLVMAQKFVLLGYVILYIISMNRFNEKLEEISVLEEDINLTPYNLIKLSYLISIYANILRLIGFIEIQSVNQGGVIIE